ncbi:MAG: phosphate ABC transporter substrate-binding protein [Pirellulaceae bacterium]|nr:phosphate ABC transporter substrate-binding protein [Pirellulaceae bacterium]
MIRQEPARIGRPVSAMHRWAVRTVVTAIACGFLASGVGCDRRAGSSPDGGTVIRVEGSDTMVNLAQAWAETYNLKHPEVCIQVLGGGSGVGIASLIDGNCDMANSSRQIKADESQKVAAAHGAEPKEIVVGYDALAIYVHKSNPADTISLAQLAEVYGWDGAITRWSQLDGGHRWDARDTIVRVSRQAGCGTYSYFREAVLGKQRDFKLGSVDQSGSKAVVALVSKTPNAIGYSGMGYQIPEIKMLRVAQRAGQPGVSPTSENAKNGSYPITRPLLIYTVGEPAGPVKDYLDWIHSAEGQTVVRELGYVSLGEHE